MTTLTEDNILDQIYEKQIFLDFYYEDLNFESIIDENMNISKKYIAKISNKLFISIFGLKCFPHL